MSARELRRIAAVLPVAIMLRALSAHADTLSSPPSALEPLRGVADAYARGLDAGWGWPTFSARRIAGGMSGVRSCRKRGNEMSPRKKKLIANFCAYMVQFIYVI
jgi:hypothetical protein